MSRWLQAARAGEPCPDSILTKDKTDATDKTYDSGGKGEVLSVSGNDPADKVTADLSHVISALDVSSVSSVLSEDVKANFQAGAVSSASSPSRPDYPPGAIVHLSRYPPKLDHNGRPVRVLPTHPATCAICGRADWHVGMTDMKGRTLHVRCWKAEGGKS